MARGSILTRPNKDGTKTYYVKYRAADGTQIKRAIGPSVREAEEALAAEIAAINRGERRAVSKDTFETVAQAWLDRRRPRLEPSTYGNYETDLRLRLIPAFGPLRLRDITRARIESYLARLDAEGNLSRKTINDSLIPLKQILSRAVIDGHIPANPALDRDRDEPLKLPQERPAMLVLSREDALRYLNGTPDWYRPLAEILIGTGMRLGEAIALEWRDIDFDTLSIGVQRAVKQRDRSVGSTKSDRGRTVLIDPFIRDVLREQRDRQRRAGVLTPLVFPSRERTHLCHSAVWKNGHRATLRTTGLHPRLRVHDLRHTAATLWLAAGESVYFVMQQLGHGDIKTTISTYGHPDRDAHAVAAARAAAWWRTPTGTTAGTTTPLTARIGGQ